MVEFIKNLFKPKCHKWITTHVNRYEHSTGEYCTLCDLKRIIATTSKRKLMVKWVYSDGTESKEFNHFSNETRVKF